MTRRPGSPPNDAAAAARHAPNSSAQRRDWSADMARAQNGDREAYRALLADLLVYVRVLARRRFAADAEVEDAVQDVLLSLHSIRHTYDPARPFLPWLLVIAQRRFIDRMRRHGAGAGREVPLGEEHETIAAPEANPLIEEWSGVALQAAIEGLPEGQRQAIRLLKLKEMSLKEAAQATGMSVAALKVASHRAIKRLRALLQRSGGLA